MFSQWIGTSRYVYNKALCGTKNGEKMNFQSLRNKYVTSKNNPLINEWEIETPKDIRAESIRDMVKAFNTAMINLRNNNIKEFNLKYRTKKKESSIAIPPSAFKIKNNKLYIYNTYMKEPLKLSKDKSLINLKIEHTCRLKNEGGKWFLNIPIKSSLEEELAQSEACSLDPGTRKFQTIYSEENIIKIGIRKEQIKKLQDKLDCLQSLRSRKIIKKSRYVQKYNKIQFRLKNLIDELHYQTISYLTKTFKTIFIPKFESQELIGINKSKKFCRNLLLLKHFTFRERLIAKSKRKNGCHIHVCTEEYTSKTCSVCGNINRDLGSDETYDCVKCNLKIDRDINGARNIYIKNIKELY
jgi:putative transposase